MKAVNIHAAKTHLSALIEEALRGEDIVIAKAGKPLVRLVPLTKEKYDRRPGRLKHLIKLKPGFDDPLPREIAEVFGQNS